MQHIIGHCWEKRLRTGTVTQVPCGLPAVLRAKSLASVSKRQPCILPSPGLDPFWHTGMTFFHGGNDRCRKGLARRWEIRAKKRMAYSGTVYKIDQDKQKQGHLKWTSHFYSWNWPFSWQILSVYEISKWFPSQKKLFLFLYFFSFGMYLPSLLMLTLNLNCSLSSERMQDCGASWCGLQNSWHRSAWGGLGLWLLPCCLAQFPVTPMFLWSPHSCRWPPCHHSGPGLPLRDVGWPGPVI